MLNDLPVNDIIMHDITCWMTGKNIIGIKDFGPVIDYFI